MTEWNEEAKRIEVEQRSTRMHTIFVLQFVRYNHELYERQTIIKVVLHYIQAYLHGWFYKYLSITIQLPKFFVIPFRRILSELTLMI